MPFFGGADKHALMRFDWTADRLRLDDEIGVAALFRPDYLTFPELRRLAGSFCPGAFYLRSNAQGLPKGLCAFDKRPERDDERDRHRNDEEVLGQLQISLGLDQNRLIISAVP